MKQKKIRLRAISETIPADLETPVSAFLKIAAREKHCFLLESAEQQEKIGRYSFIGVRPKSVISCSNGKIREERNGGAVLASGNVVDYLENLLSRYHLANPEDLPSFCGGLVGYLSYENVRNFENIRLEPRNKLSVPEAIFFLTEDLIIFDHFKKTLSIVVLSEKSGTAKSRIRYLIHQLRKPLPQGKPAAVQKLAVQSNVTRSEFQRKVGKIKEYIRAGDAIQVVLSQRFRLPAVPNDFQIYRSLRSINPSPYMFYFRSGKICLIGSSPEVLVKKTGSEAEVRPIAGTRKRGVTPEEDAALEEQLKRSKKEMAEHLMLVDLGRNDLGRVCDFDSIRVKNFARVERYSHVMHLVSDVTGHLKKGKTAFDLLKATFPAGTVTGAPKIRAMQIINELETDERGPYAGCLGYFSFNRDMDMCITIRTLILDGKNIYLQAGAGIVKDSRPEKEYMETVNKAKALMKALESRHHF